METDTINNIDGLPPKVPLVPLTERRVFTLNGGAFSEKLSALPETHFVTLSQESLMTALLDPASLTKEERDYFVPYVYDEAAFIMNDVERMRKEREKITGVGPHLFYDQAAPDIRIYDVGLNSGKMDGTLFNLPVETSLLLAEIGTGKESKVCR